MIFWLELYHLGFWAKDSATSRKLLRFLLIYVLNLFWWVDCQHTLAEIEKAEEEDEEKSDANVRSDDAQESGEKESDEEDGSESSEEDDSESGTTCTSLHLFYSLYDSTVSTW